MLSNLLNLYVTAVILALVQGVAAVPWLIVLNLNTMRARKQPPTLATWLRWFGLGLLGVCTVGAGIVFAALWRQVPDSLQLYGGIYGFVLHVQLVADFFILTFAVLLGVWPKGAAVALSAFREGWRQPMFWLLLSFALVLMAVTPFLPYFTFGEDYKMVTELGYDFIMLFAALFGVLAASMSITEEIEGRTAVTLMSKPVSRRQFLVGKYLGIFLASLLMATVLSFAFYGILLRKIDRDEIPVPEWLTAVTPTWIARFGEVPGNFLSGIGFWFGHVSSLSPGVVLGLCQVMVLLAVAVALATRLPMIVNLVVCLVIFFLGHLTPFLEQVSQSRFVLVKFMAETFGTLIPGLDVFNLGPVIARDAPPASGPFLTYLGIATLYAVSYTAIALLFGLILFEDRDLA